MRADETQKAQIAADLDMARIEADKELALKELEIRPKLKPVPHLILVIETRILYYLI